MKNVVLLYGLPASKGDPDVRLLGLIYAICRRNFFYMHSFTFTIERQGYSKGGNTRLKCIWWIEDASVRCLAFQGGT